MKQFFANLTTRLAKGRNTNMQTNRTQQLLQPAVATDNLKFEICNLKLFRGCLLLLLFVLVTGNAWAEDKKDSITCSYSSNGLTGWSLTNYTDKSTYFLVPNSGTYSVANIANIFSNKKITGVTITINHATYNSGNNPTAGTFSFYTSSDCSTSVAATQSGTLASSSSFTNVIYTISKTDAANFESDLAIKITKPGKQIRLKSIKVVYTYTTSTCPKTPTLTISNKSITLTEAETGNYDLTSNLTIDKGGSAGTISYSCDNTDVDVTGGKFQVLDPGTYTINATMAESGDYCEASTTFTITVVDDCTPPAAELSYTSGSCLTNVAFDLDGLKTGGNGGTVTYTCTATSGVTISNNSATFSKEGTYTFTATQAKNGNVCAGSATFTVTASLPTYTITWLVDNVATTEGEPTTSVKQGSKITKLPTTPTVPNGCGEKVFMGWSETNIGTTPGSKPDDLFTTAPTTAPTGNKTYYAVFATKSDGGTATLTIDAAKTTFFPTEETTYTSTPFEYSSITFGRANAYKNNGGIQIKSGTSNFVYNIDPIPGAITSIKVTKITNNSTLTVGTSSKPTTNSKTVSSTTTYSFDESANLSYFKIAAGSSYVVVGEIVITYSNVTYSDYITTCEECDAPTTELSLTGETALSLGEDGATITVTAAGGNGGEITFACSDASVTVTKLTSTTASVKFTDSGKFTITAKQAKNGTTCSQSASLVVNVSATPTINISQSEALNVTIPCGTGTKNQTVTLSGYNLTEGIKVTSSNSAITVSNAANGTYGSSATYAASNKKVNTPLYIQITAPAESTTAISGTLTFTSKDATSQTLTVNATVTCQQYTLTFNANGGSNAPSAQKCYGGSPVTLPDQGSMTAPTNKVFVGWNTDKNATTALESYTMPTEDDVLYAIWRAANYQIACGDVTLTTQAGNQAAQTVTVTLTDQSEYTASAVSGKNKDMFTASGSGSSLNVTFNPPAGTAEGTYTAQVTLTGALGGSCTVTLTGVVNSLAVLSWENSAESYCYDTNTGNLTIYLDNALIYKDGAEIGTNDNDFCNNVTLTDVTLGTNVKIGVNTGAFAKTESGLAWIEFYRAGMTLGHTYRLTFTNAAGLTDDKGLQYANATCEFTIKNCSTVTMLPPCPVTTTGFTAKWDNTGCTGEQTLSVYQKDETLLVDAQFFKGSATQTSVSQYASIKDGVWAVSDKNAQSAQATGYGMKDDLYSPTFETWKSDITENDEMTVTVKAYNAVTTGAQTLTASVVAKANGGSPTKKTVIIDGASKTEIKSPSIATNNYGEFSFTLSGVSASDRMFFEQSGSSANFRMYSVTIKTLSKSNAKDITVDCSAKEAAVTGLTAGQTYYYTLGNGTEQKVTTRSGEPELAFDLGKLNIQSTDGVCATGVVDVVGENVSACDVNVSLDGTNKEMFTLDTSNLTYDVTTGTVGGSVSVEFCPGTARGTKTATLTITAGSVTNTIDIEGTSCSSFSPSSTTVGSTYAVANLGTTMSGTVSVTDLGKEGENILTNPGFETDATTGWTTSWTSVLTVAQSSTKKHSGSYSLYASNSGNSRTLDGYTVSCLYSNQVTLDGDYTLSFYVYLPKKGQKEEFCFGLVNTDNKVMVTEYSGKIKDVDQWVLVKAQFSGLSGNGIVVIGRRTTGTDPFYIDDVSLCKTSSGGTQTIDFSGSSATMGNLWPGHSYSYTLKNNDSGCEYGPFTFTTIDSAMTPAINVESPITISCQAGKTATSMVLVETTWIISNVEINKPNDNACGKFSLSTTSIQSAGGSVMVTFTPGADVAGSVFKCTLTLTGTGSTGEGSATVSKTVELNGVVSAGADPSTPMIEVVDIDTTMMAVEHNIAGVDSVEIKLSREKNPSEVKKNVGCEIFFSKYYEASRDVKLWAIYNPTDTIISLKDTYVWIGTEEWRPKYTLCDLQHLGGFEKGKIYPQEEIIVYGSDGWGKVLTCAATKADMSSWYGMDPQGTSALSFDGNDALTLVRAETNERYTGKTYKTNEFKQYKYKIDGRDTTFNWRYIVMPCYHKDTTAEGVVKPTKILSGDSVRFQMLDLIGARKSSNQPDNSKCKQPQFNENDGGDEKGWVSKTGKDMNGKDYENKGGEYDVLSTNRCLLVRSKEVKAGSAAITKNQGDFYTLGTEWQGAYVPMETKSEDEIVTSCDNFSYAGGFDYASYYSAYTSLSGDEYHFGLQLVDSTYKTSDFKTLTDYTCQKLLIECVVYDTIGGIGVRTVKASTEYKVPIIVNKVTTTADKTIFNYSTDTCKECDVVILANKRLSHNDGNQWHQFRDMKVFPGGNFYIGTGQSFTLRNLEMQAKNDTVSYAKIDGTLTVTGDLVHEKRIDSKNWYCFSLPYACNLAAVRQLNGKSLGEYNKDWWIQYYDGAERAEKGTWNEAGTGYNGASYWKTFAGTETLEANVAYLIGIGGINESTVRYKTIYFPPSAQADSYTEESPETKSVSVEAHVGASVSAGHENDRGWNFIGNPYISIFNQSGNNNGVNSADKLYFGHWNGTDYDTKSKIYVNVPDGKGKYVQNEASSIQLYPFKGYFIQVAGDADTELNFAKGQRVLQVAEAPSSELHADVILQIADAAGNNDVTGILVDEDYTDSYEVARDLTKMGSTTQDGPQLWTYITDGTRQRLAFNALPAASAKRIPLSIYAPKAGDYTLSINQMQSDLSGVTAVTLYYGETAVANLLDGDFTITTNRRATDNGYSITVERVAQITTPINNNLSDAAAPIVVLNNGQVSVEQLPASGNLMVVDAVGRQIWSHALDGSATCSLQHLPAGVYMIVVDGNNQRYLLRTIVK